MIEILAPTRMCATGERVGASEATLLGMLNVMPFAYGLEVKVCLVAITGWVVL